MARNAGDALALSASGFGAGAAAHEGIGSWAFLVAAALCAVALLLVRRGERSRPR